VKGNVEREYRLRGARNACIEVIDYGDEYMGKLRERLIVLTRAIGEVKIESEVWMGV
jgi:hypothetical protein